MSPADETRIARESVTPVRRPKGGRGNLYSVTVAKRDMGSRR